MLDNEIERNIIQINNDINHDLKPRVNQLMCDVGSLQRLDREVEMFNKALKEHDRNTESEIRKQIEILDIKNRVELLELSKQMNRILKNQEEAIENTYKQFNREQTQDEIKQKQNKELHNLNFSMKFSQKIIEDQERRIKAQEGMLSDLDKNICGKEILIKNLRAAIEEQDNHIKMLKNDIRDLLDVIDYPKSDHCRVATVSRCYGSIGVVKD